MAMQINLKLSDRMFATAKNIAEAKGFDSLQDFIRDLLRRTLFDNENIGGRYTMLASGESLGRQWLTKEEDEAWKHLQKVT